MHNTSHSTQFQALTKHLLLAFSSAGAIPRMPVQDIDHYSELAVFHDAGKKAIPPAILNKPGFLTPEEFSIMKSHTTEGCRLLAEDPALSAREDFPLICDVCRHHHERWDGGGYPDGLTGCQIAPWVQVVGLADAFDALIHPRSYKPAYLWTQAASMISDGACGAFSPDILICFRYHIGGVYAAVY
ncbi:HD-GYP domain-containing protein [uncultured Oscillibacter sp.]|uniref:HD-GYP domain-containing protein n=1 Tax=uncultured Oscillibacter sp. TaxID=876091 RepID=UPI00263303D6|nr:HD domain-containing phosphohydrolase [uncultured Oscillibacter sp.]